MTTPKPKGCTHAFSPSDYLQQHASFAGDWISAHPSVRYAQLHWVDFSGVLRTWIIPKDRLLDMAQGRSRYSLAQNCMIVPILPAPECFGPGPEQWRLHPDWSSLRLCGHHDSHAEVMCFVERVWPERSFSRCPRALLLDMLDRWRCWQPHIQFRAGFELEFVLLDASSPLLEVWRPPADAVAGYSTMAGLRGETLSIVEEIVAALDRAGTGVYHFQTEGIDQIEIALMPAAPMQAIDALVCAQETVRAVCARRGLKATFAPRPLLNNAASLLNGTHLHLSSYSIAPSMATSVADAAMRSIVAGALRKMVALCAFGMASTDSYVRCTDDAAGKWIGYGTENRDLPIRRIANSHGDDDNTKSPRFEFRFLDATANPYLFLATLLAVGLNESAKMEDLGAQQPLVPVPGSHKHDFKDCTVSIDPDTKDLGSYGITQRMPESLRVTVDAASRDTDLEHWIGPELMRQYLAIKRHEIDFASRMTDLEKRLKFLAFF